MKRFLLLGLIGAAIFLGLNAEVYPGTDKSPVLDLHFSKDSGSTTPDASGNGNYGMVIGATWTSAGKIGGAFKFNGFDSYIDCGKRKSLNLGTGDFTIGAWIKTGTTGKWQWIINSGAYGKEKGTFGLGIRPSNLLQAGYRWRTAGGVHQYKNRTSTPSPTSLNDGRWHYLAVVVKRDFQGGIPRLYIDGVEDISGDTASKGSASAIVINNQDPLFIGASSPNPSGYFKGLIDEVRIYKKALTSGEIRNYYEKTKGEEPIGPVAERSPKAQIKETSDGILMFNNRLAITFDKNSGVPGTVTLLPEGYPLMPRIWYGSVSYYLMAKSMGGETIFKRPYQTDNRGPVTFATEQGAGFARVSGEAERVDRNKTPLIKIQYTYRLADDKPYVEANYTITALAAFKASNSAFFFRLLGDTVVYPDEAGYISTKFLDTDWGKERVSWKENIPVQNFWMASRKSGGKYSVGILRPGKSNLKNYIFSGRYLFFAPPKVFKGVVEKGAVIKARFYILGIHRKSVDDRRAEAEAMRKLLDEVKKNP